MWTLILFQCWTEEKRLSFVWTNQLRSILQKITKQLYRNTIPWQKLWNERNFNLRVPYCSKNNTIKNCIKIWLSECEFLFLTFFNSTFDNSKIHIFKKHKRKTYKTHFFVKQARLCWYLRHLRLLWEFWWIDLISAICFEIGDFLSTGQLRTHSFVLFIHPDPGYQFAFIIHLPFFLIWVINFWIDAFWDAPSLRHPSSERISFSTFILSH